jgi:hypothetical protein
MQIWHMMAIVQALTSFFDARTFYREKQVGACEPTYCISTGQTTSDRQTGGL